MKDISKGYIALFRQFINWEWFTDVNTCHLFLYCLLKANHKNTKWKGIDIKKGSFVTSYQSLSEATGLSIRNVRTSLKKLTNKTTSELTHKTTNHYSIITVKNWGLYQQNDKQSDKQTDNQVTTDNNENKCTISYINISLSIEERELLKKYLLTKPRKEPIYDWDAYFALMNRNGTLKIKLEKAKKWAENKRKKEVILEEEVSAEETQEAIKRTQEYLKQRGIICKSK